MSRQQPYAVVTDSRALRRVRMALIASVAVLVLGLAGVGLGFNDRINDLKDNADAANADRAEVKADLSAALAKANERLVEAGEKPVTAPPVAGPQGLPGDVGRPPTPDEIRDAVAAYCSGGKCRGPAGASVTRGEVAAAVTVFCDARGECRGPRGGAGGDGTDGSDGGTGPQGPPPTDAQVSAAVAAFCADGRCRGAVGPVGPQGPAGAPGGDGRGIASIICESVPELRLVINFTDGTRQTVDCTLVGSSGQG